MAFRPFEVNVAHLAYTILGAFVVLFGMFSLGERIRLFDSWRKPRLPAQNANVNLSHSDQGKSLHW